MKDRILIVLVTLTLAFQAIALYRQYRPKEEPRSATPQGAVLDAKAGTTLDVSGVPIRGNPKSSVILIEFSDFECPFCERHATGVAKVLDKEFVATGRIRYAFANNPLPMHPSAKALATAAVCADEQGQYWEMHDMLFAQKPRSKPDVYKRARQLGMNAAVLQRCMETATEPVKRVERQMEQARDLNLTGTPAFVVGEIQPDGAVIAHKLVRGAQRLEMFRQAIEEVLRKVQSSAKAQALR